MESDAKSSGKLDKTTRSETYRKSRTPARRRPDNANTPSNPAPHPVTQKVLEVLRGKAPSAPADLEHPAPTPTPSSEDVDPLPARMLNEFVYCPRLFYYEHVEGLFLKSEDTVRGASLHQRVDRGSGALAPAKAKTDTGTVTETEEREEESIHARSVTLASDRLGVIAKMDLVEGVGSEGRAECVAPVDYKLGKPRKNEDGSLGLWDADRMQIGLQCLILRDNGYTCEEGIVYYRATKQRVRLPLTPELENWIEENIRQARMAMEGPIPEPLVNSPKCVRCSLAPICLPDETRFLKDPEEPDDLFPVRLKTPAVFPEESAPGETTSMPSENSESGAAALESRLETTPPRRLMAPRDDRRALYLTTPGLSLGLSGETLQVRNKDKGVLDSVRLADVCQISLFGPIQISTQAVHVLCRKEIPLAYHSSGGWFHGLTRGHSLPNVYTRIAQFAAAGLADSSLDLARRFVAGKIRNQRTMLMRNHLEPPAATLKQLKRHARVAREASSLAELLGLEGTAAALYFQNFSGMIKTRDEVDTLDETPETTEPNTEGAPQADAFNFQQRNRRPPRDPVNALLSLAYSMLTRDCTVAAFAVGLDPYVGFLHQPRFGRPALALDVMEEFRPLIADSAVLYLLNNRMLQPSHFVRAGDAVNLTAQGRKVFYQAYEHRLTSVITHPVFGYKVGYRRAIELQMRLLARVLTGEIPEYLPFTTR